ncbi:hypothetical protein TNCT_590171 [Trichonephila clavata]|uniref:Uncharacterized protein n=1 Tax=Trichonephila clavata TaxID=2740835 RepID=A0A8X6HHZ2_TRICU|nr:hypothetical protein TNCT_590171 [Trichonephila clavata]
MSEYKVRMYSCKISAVFLIILLAEVIHVSTKKGVLFRHISLKPPLLLDGTKQLMLISLGWNLIFEEMLQFISTFCKIL